MNCPLGVPVTVAMANVDICFGLSARTGIEKNKDTIITKKKSIAPPAFFCINAPGWFLQNPVYALSNLKIPNKFY
jgi:sporulation-control protein spo0M